MTHRTDRAYLPPYMDRCCAASCLDRDRCLRWLASVPQGGSMRDFKAERPGPACGFRVAPDTTFDTAKHSEAKPYMRGL